MLLFLRLIILFFLNQNPLSMALILLLSTAPLFSIAAEIRSVWFGLRIILIFSGGIIIIFLYMTRLCRNYKFNIKFSHTFIFLFLLPFFPTNFGRVLPCRKFKLFYLYNLNNLIIFAFIVIYLLLTLILIVSLSQFYKGSLKKFY